MDSPESSRNYVKRDVEDGLGVKNDRAGDDEGWDGSDRRKHRSSRSRKSSNGEDADGLDNSGRKKHMGTEVTVGKGQEAPVEEIATKMNMIQGKNHVQNRRKNKKRAP